MNTIAISQDQDVALFVLGEVPIPEHFRELDHGTPPICFRGVFWLRAEEPPVLEVYYAFNEDDEGYHMAFLGPVNEHDDEVLERVMQLAPGDLFARRIAELLDYWDGRMEDNDVLVGEMVLWSQIAGEG